jgi:predicted membrane protein
VDQKSVQECNAYVAERCWPRIILLLFGAVFVIGSFMPFIYLQSDVIIRFVFPLVWGFFAVWFIFVTFVIHLWNKKKKAWQWVLYGTDRAHGCCKALLFVFRFASPLVLYLLLWIPRILQSVPAYAVVDAATLTMYNWIVFSVYIGLIFIGITACACVDYCCKFTGEEEGQDDSVALGQMESHSHQHSHQQQHSYMGQQHQHSSQHQHHHHPHQHIHSHQHHAATIEYLVESESGDQVMVIEQINV